MAERSEATHSQSKPTRLITEAARAAGAASPMIDVCHALYRETRDLGLDGADIIAVVRAIERRERSSLRAPARRMGDGMPV